jgi:hypothetical protein
MTDAIGDSTDRRSPSWVGSGETPQASGSSDQAIGSSDQASGSSD